MVQTIHSTPGRSPLALLGGVERAIDLAAQDDSAVVHLFKPDWEGVDLARRCIASAGLESRVIARHVDALRLAGTSAAHFRWTR